MKAKPYTLPKILNELKMESKRRCCKCKEIKNLAEFSKSNQENKYPYCILCKRASHKKHHKKKILQKFDISLKQYELLFNIQKNKCAICKKEETFINCHTKEIIKLAVDHCHITGKIRGLLCRYCNLMIGNSKDSIKILRSAIRYLQKHELQLLCKDVADTPIPM